MRSRSLSASMVTLALVITCEGCAGAQAEPAAVSVEWPARTRYRTVEIGGRKVFYREAGTRDKPTILLLHGYPSSSHTYRELIPLLSGRFHVVAPDNLGSGFSDRPDPAEVRYTFDLLAEQMAGFVEALELRSFVLYMQDFGAPVGFRLAMAMPERLRGLVVQNANAYLDGLTPARQEFFQRAHDDRSPEHVATLFDHTGREGVIQRQYLRDVPGDKQTLMSPDAWTHDLAGLATAADRMIQVQLFQDYASNLAAYPRWQAFLRERRPPLLVVWGRHDPAFIAAGAEAYRRDVPDAEVHLIDAGHFAVEEQPVLVAQHVTSFMLALER